MRDAFHHEALYRGANALEKLSQAKLTVCGAGAVGSNLVDNLTRQGFRMLGVIDFDRIEAHNVGTQTYAESDAGAFKVDVLQTEVFRTVGIEIKAIRKRLTDQNVSKLLASSDLVIDGLDNHDSRALVTEHCHATGIPCLHVGLSADYAQVMWNEGYQVPHDVAPEQAPPGIDVCDYPLARNLIQFAVALASEAVVRFILDGQKQDYSFTLRDFKVNVEAQTNG